MPTHEGGLGGLVRPARAVRLAAPCPILLAAALTSIGIPKDSIVKYELEVKTGKFLVLANGSADMIEHARGVLKVHGRIGARGPRRAI